MSPAPRLAWDNVNRLFSIVMDLDEDLTVLDCSATLRKYVAGLDAAPKLTDVFKINRPRQIESYADILEKLDSLFLMTTCDEQFAVRGQMIRTSNDEDNRLLFCGAPWLFWLDSNVPDLRLGLADFSTQDVQLDQLFYMSTEKRMVQDLELVNVELNQARQEAEEAHADKSRFFAQMSHEMRTPLNGVVSALTLMEESQLDAKTQQLLALARSSSRNLLQVINHVLDVSKLESQQGEINNTVFDLRALVESVVDVIRARAVQKSLALELDLDMTLPRHFNTDRERIQQTLLNLLHNAIKYADAGAITVRVRRADRFGSTGGVHFEVQDAGPGIPAEIQSSIFEPFWTSATSDANAQEAGTGLGLDIVRRNVEAMQGRFGVESESGTGSRFWFELPLQPVDQTVVSMAPNPMEDTPGPQFRGRVLLVDDNETNLMLGVMLLEDFGVTVISASSGADALALLEQQDFELVLMDLSMPRMSGIEATEKIRERETGGAVPIVALTAHADRRQEEKCLSIGMNGYMTKPVELNRLAEELGNWLESTPDECAPGELPVQPNGTPREPLAKLHTEDIDLSILNDLRQQLGASNFAKVLLKFRAEARTRMIAMDGAAATGDGGELARQAHSLASSFRSFGLIEAGDALAELESDMKQDIDTVDLAAFEFTKSLLEDGLAALQNASGD